MTMVSPERTDDTVMLIDPTTGAMLDDELYTPYLADVDDNMLRAIYQDMVIVRRMDTEAWSLQRQGELGIWAPLLGQEAAQIGSARALRQSDFIFGSYRENAVAYVRGIEPSDMLGLWRGTSQSDWDPYQHNMMTPAIVIAAQLLPAVGYAMGIKRDKSADIAVSYFGDGSTSQGDFSEALGFASSFSVPVVFICQNNQYAISAPVGVQTTVPIAQRASGFGMRGIRVDGNDVLAMLAVTRYAAERARAGDGPTLIEAVTYRMGPHTTSDDPTRYRDEHELALWKERDPIDRFTRALESRGLLTDELEQDVAAAADAFAVTLRAGALALQDPAPDSFFEHVYSEPHLLIDEERADFRAYHGLAQENEHA